MENKFKCLGLKASKDREENDYYSTDPKGVEDLIRMLNENNIIVPHEIVESSVGSGNIAKVFEDKGCHITGYDIVDRGWHDTIVTDYLLVDKLPECCDNGCMIVENTPFKYTQEFVEHGLSLIKDGEYICSLQKIQFLESQDRKVFFGRTPPKFVFVFSKRLNCYKGGDISRKGGMFCFCWFVFQKGYKGDTVVKWI